MKYEHSYHNFTSFCFTVPSSGIRPPPPLLFWWNCRLIHYLAMGIFGPLHLGHDGHVSVDRIHFHLGASLHLHGQHPGTFRVGRGPLRNDVSMDGPYSWGIGHRHDHYLHTFCSHVRHQCCSNDNHGSHCPSIYA